MAKNKYIYDFTIKLNSNDVLDQLKKIGQEADSMFKKVGKTKSFDDAFKYMTGIGDSLDEFKKEHSNLFAEAFGDFDESRLKKILAVFSKFSGSGEKIDHVLSRGILAKPEQLKEAAKYANDLAAALGKTDVLDIDKMFNGGSSKKDIISAIRSHVQSVVGDALRETSIGTTKARAYGWAATAKHETGRSNLDQSLSPFFEFLAAFKAAGAKTSDSGLKLLRQRYAEFVPSDIFEEFVRQYFSSEIDADALYKKLAMSFENAPKEIDLSKTVVPIFEEFDKIITDETMDVREKASKLSAISKRYSSLSNDYSRPNQRFFTDSYQIDGPEYRSTISAFFDAIESWKTSSGYDKIVEAKKKLDDAKKLRDTQKYGDFNQVAQAESSLEELMSAYIDIAEKGTLTSDELTEFSAALTEIRTDLIEARKSLDSGLVFTKKTKDVATDAQGTSSPVKQETVPTASAFLAKIEELRQKPLDLITRDEMLELQNAYMQLQNIGAVTDAVKGSFDAITSEIRTTKIDKLKALTGKDQDGRDITDTSKLDEIVKERKFLIETLGLKDEFLRKEQDITNSIQRSADSLKRQQAAQEEANGRLAEFERLLAEIKKKSYSDVTEEELSKLKEQVDIIRKLRGVDRTAINKASNDYGKFIVDRQKQELTTLTGKDANGEWIKDLRTLHDIGHRRQELIYLLREGKNISEADLEIQTKISEELGKHTKATRERNEETKRQEEIAKLLSDYSSSAKDLEGKDSETLLGKIRNREWTKQELETKYGTKVDEPDDTKKLVEEYARVRVGELQKKITKETHGSDVNWYAEQIFNIIKEYGSFLSEGAKSEYKKIADDMREDADKRIIDRDKNPNTRKEAEDRLEEYWRSRNGGVLGEDEAKTLEDSRKKTREYEVSDARAALDRWDKDYFGFDGNVIKNKSFAGVQGALTDRKKLLDALAGFGELTQEEFVRENEKQKKLYEEYIKKAEKEGIKLKQAQKNLEQFFVSDKGVQFIQVETDDRDVGGVSRDFVGDVRQVETDEGDIGGVSQDFVEYARQVQKTKDPLGIIDELFETTFDEKKQGQLYSLSKYKKDLGDIGYLSEDLKAELTNLEASFQGVSDEAGLQEIVKQFETLKNKIEAARLEKEKFDEVKAETIKQFDSYMSEEDIGDLDYLDQRIKDELSGVGDSIKNATSQTELDDAVRKFRELNAEIKEAKKNEADRIEYEAELQRQAAEQAREAAKQSAETKRQETLLEAKRVFDEDFNDNTAVENVEEMRRALLELQTQGLLTEEQMKEVADAIARINAKQASYDRQSDWRGKFDAASTYEEAESLYRDIGSEEYDFGFIDKAVEDKLAQLKAIKDAKESLSEADRKTEYDAEFVSKLEKTRAGFENIEGVSDEIKANIESTTRSLDEAIARMNALKQEDPVATPKVEEVQKESKPLKDNSETRKKYKDSSDAAYKAQLEKKAFGAKEYVDRVYSELDLQDDAKEISSAYEEVSSILDKAFSGEISSWKSVQQELKGFIALVEQYKKAKRPVVEDSLKIVEDSDGQLAVDGFERSETKNADDVSSIVDSKIEEDKDQLVIDGFDKVGAASTELAQKIEKTSDVIAEKTATPPTKEKKKPPVPPAPVDDGEPSDESDPSRWNIDTVKDIVSKVRSDMKKLGISSAKEELTGDAREIAESYDIIQGELSQMAEKAKEGEAIELSSINSKIKALQELITKYKEATKAAEPKAGEKASAPSAKDNKKYGSTSWITTQAKHKTIMSAAAGFGGSQSFIDKLSSYEAAYSKVEAMKLKMESTTGDLGDLKVDFKAATDECAKLGREIEGIIKKSNQAATETEQSRLGEDFVDNYEGRKAALEEFISEHYSGRATIDEFSDGYRKCTYTIDEGGRSFKQASAAIDSYANRINYAEGETQKFKSSIGKIVDEVKSKFGSLFTYFISMFGVQEIFQQIRQGVQYVTEIDSALTELKKVTDETDESYDKFLKNMSKTASTVGSTVKDLTNSAADWARIGYSMEEAGELAATTAKLLNVSEFESVDDATSALVSSLQAFTTEGEDVGVRAEEIVDILNNIGNKYPVATNELADGLAASGAALVAANNSIEEQVAMLAAGNATMQDISSVAAGLKIVAARLRGTTTEEDDDADSAIKNVSKLQEKIKELTKEANGGEGIDIINEEGEYKSTWKILAEISEIYDKMDDMSQASLLELIAGKNRSSVVAALLQNGDILKDAHAEAFDSFGSSEKELNTYLDSIQGRVDIFNNEMQTMWMNFIKSDWVKTIVDAGTEVIKLVNSLGMIPTAFSAIMAYFVLFKKISPIGAIKEIYSALSGYKTAIQTLNDLTTEGLNSQSIAQYAQAVSGLTEKKQALALAGAGLNRETIKEAMLMNQVSESTIDKIMSEGELASAKNLTTIATVGETVVLSAEEKMKLSAEATDWLLNNSEKQLTLSLLQEMQTHGLITEEVAQEIAEKNKLVAVNKQTEKGSGFLAQFKSMPMLGKIGLIVGFVTTIYTVVKKVYDHFVTTADELVEKWDELKTEISDINSELDKTKSRIEDLESKGALSFTDKKELEQLRQTNEELERRLRLKEQEEAKTASSAREEIKKEYQLYTTYTVDSQMLDKESTKIINDATRIGRHLDSIKTAYSNNVFAGFSDSIQSEIKSLVSSDTYRELMTESWSTMSERARAEINLILDECDAALSKFTGINQTGMALVDSEKYVDILTKRIEELKSKIFDDQGIIKDGISDEYVKTVTDTINEYENKLLTVASDLYEYLDKYDGDESDEFVKILQGQIDQIDKTLNPVEFYSKKFDEIFGKFSDQKRELYELAEQGKLTADALNSTTYQPLMTEMYKLGVTAQDVVDHINSLGEVDLHKVASPTFSISDYETGIDLVQERISEYDSALKSLQEGTFTYSDFIDLTQKFPKLAKGVDVSTKSFKGLEKNLKRAIKAAPEELVDELKDLRKQLLATGKSTDELDQLITLMENTPTDTIEKAAKEYSTLTDEINAAKQAQNELQEAMSENPNEGYETRGEAMEYMKDKLSRGEKGSESEVWDVAKEYGFTYDSAKSIDENADALAKFIAIREKWFKKDDDGNYTFDGTEDFIQSVENAVAGNEKLQSILQWGYNDQTGEFSFDFDNKNFEEIVKLLSQTEELAGLTEEEFSDMLVQIGQYYGITWGRAKDVIDEINSIASSAADAKTKVEEYGEAMQTGFGKDTKIDLTNRPRIALGDGSYETVDSRAYSNEDETVTITVTPILPDGTKLTDEELQKYTEDIINGADPATYEFEVNGKTYTGDDIVLAKHYGEDSIEQANEYGKALHDAQERYYALVDEMKTNPFSIKLDGDIETDIIKPLKEAGLKVDEIIDEAGNKQFVFDVIDVETLLRDSGYSSQNIAAIIDKLFGEGSGASQLAKIREDIRSISTVSQDTCDQLDALGVKYNLVGNSQGAVLYVDSNIEEILRAYQFTDQEIEAFKQRWEENGIYINTTADISGSEEAKNAVEDIPEDVTTTAHAETDEYKTKMQEAIDLADELGKSRTATITINQTTRERVIKEEVSGGSTPSRKSNSNRRQNLQYVNGTAHAHGSWGATESETSLMGELGPELV